VVFETLTTPDVRGRGVSTAVRTEILRFFRQRATTGCSAVLRLPPARPCVQGEPVRGMACGGHGTVPPTETALSRRGHLSLARGQTGIATRPHGRVPCSVRQ